MSKRKGLSASVRFEVFKRDRFACQYCGRHPPDVLLEVDHIVPVAAGGDNSEENLRTACRQCNSGKSDRLLEEGSGPGPMVSRAQVDDLNERTKQAEEYAKLIAGMRDAVSRQLDLVNEAWATAFNAQTTETGWRFNMSGRFPDENSIRIFLKRLPLEMVLDAVDTTASRFSRADFGACKYFYAICWRHIKGLAPGDPK